MRAPIVASLAAVLLSGHPVAAQEEPYEPTGEVRLLASGGVGTGATFDDSRIVGPNVNLTRREDGTWGGDLAGANVSLHFEGEKRLIGSNVNLTFEQNGATTKVEGLFFGRRVRFELDRKKMQGRLGACSLDLARKNAQTLVGDIGCSSPRSGLASGRATLTLLGEAASETPPLPHLALVLVAITPG